MYIKVQDQSFPAQRILEDRLMASPMATNGPTFADRQELAQQLVRHLYLDFLDREPDEPEINYWRQRLAALGLNDDSMKSTMMMASSLLLQSVEFLHVGYLVYRFYMATYGRRPRRSEFLSDAGWIRHDVVVAQADWEGRLERNLESFSENWVARPTFETLYAKLNSDEYLAVLCENAGINISRRERYDVSDGPGAQPFSRRLILRRVVDDPDFFLNELNKAFVLLLYFGYLQRNPDDAPDLNMKGYDFWLSQLESNLTQWDVIRAFVASEEYGRRLSPFTSL